MKPAGLPALAVLGSACVLLASGCGDSAGEVSIETSSAADEELASAIVADLEGYSEGFDISALPADQQAQIGAVIDNLPQAAGSVTELTVTNGAVVAATELEPSEGTAVTARLICGAVYRSIEETRTSDPGGHVVLGAGEAVLADCRPEDASYP